MVAMKNEEKDESNKRLIKAGKIEWRSLFPSSWSPVVRDDPKTKACAAVNEEAPEYMTATYWG
jgi:hypothetical protein